HSSFTANGPVISSIFSDYWLGEPGYLYFGTKNGSIYKNLLSDVGQNVWVRNLSSEISSEVIGYYFDPPAKIYAGTVDGYVFKISTITGQDLWTPVPQLYGSIVGMPSVDDGFTSSGGSGVNSLWWGTTEGFVYRLNLQNATVLSSTRVPSAITTSIIYDAGYVNNALNTLNVYFGTQDGKLYCRYGLNLNNVPLGWNDVNVGSKINEISLSYENNVKYLYLSCDNGVYKILASSGTIVWYFPTTSAVVKPVIPSWNNNYIYFVTEEGLVFAVDKQTKQLKQGYPVYTGGRCESFCVDFIFNGFNGIILGNNAGKVEVLKE
ncbi:MAG: hypothetical protein N2Z73_02290, partial [Endomicrobia bacterium]|nr:hypothetical protein [Endomicrobiia bacterium]